MSHVNICFGIPPKYIARKKVRIVAEGEEHYGDMLIRLTQSTSVTDGLIDRTAVALRD